MMALQRSVLSPVPDYYRLAFETSSIRHAQFAGASAGEQVFALRITEHGEIHDRLAISFAEPGAFVARHDRPFHRADERESRKQAHASKTEDGIEN